MAGRSSFLPFIAFFRPARPLALTIRSTLIRSARVRAFANQRIAQIKDALKSRRTS